MTSRSPWQQRVAASGELANAVRRAALCGGPAGQIAVIRVRRTLTRAQTWEHDVRAFAADFHLIWLDRARAGDVLAVLFGHWPTVDWTRDHDVYVDRQMIRSAPGVLEPGFVPVDDQTFGSLRAGHDAVHCAPGHVWHEHILERHSPSSVTSSEATAA